LVSADKTRIYNRNYYYKRDPVKLAKYRRNYKKKLYDRLYKKVRRAEKYFINHGGRYENKEQEQMVLKFRKPKKSHSVWYMKNREKHLEYCNFKYRSDKLKEFVDNILNTSDSK
jgi:hypothetical protein